MEKIYSITRPRTSQTKTKKMLFYMCGNCFKLLDALKKKLTKIEHLAKRKKTSLHVQTFKPKTQPS